MEFSFFLPTRIIFGWNASKQLESILLEIKSKKVLLVTDSFLSKSQALSSILNFKSDIKVDIFDSVAPEPDISVAESAAEKVRQQEYDTVIGFGGGSSIDIAKLASVAATNLGKMLDYVGNELFKTKGIHSIMIPTTAGTGAELTVTSMVTVSGHKQWINSKFLLPEIAILDPELTLSMPKKVTAATGLDALCHNTEAYLSASSNPITDSVALKGIKLIVANLLDAYNDGSNRVARQNMLVAAMLGGIALQARMVYGHSIGYTIATRYNLAHGISCGIPLPYIVSHYSEACSDKMRDLAEAYGIKEDYEPKRLGTMIGEKIIGILKQLNVPTSLAELGVKKEQLEELAKECISLYYRKNSPLVFDYQSMLRFYEDIWEGKL